MFERILTPLDGSPLAEGVLPHVLSIAKVFNSEIVLLSVLNGSEGNERPLVDPLDWQVRRTDAQAYLENLRDRVEDLGFSVTCSVETGEPSETIVNELRGRSADLLAMSTHGQTGRSRWTSGSVFRNVLQRVNTSFLVVRAFNGNGNGDEHFTPKSYGNLFVPLDGSRRAECVLPIVSRIAEYNEAEIKVAHAVARPEMACRSALTEEDRELERQIMDRNCRVADEYLRTIESRLPHTQTKLQVGENAVASLHELARAIAPDLIVVSAHGYSGQCKWPYGNVSRSFIEYGTRPVLVLQDVQCEEFESPASELVSQERQGH